MSTNPATGTEERVSGSRGTWLASVLGHVFVGSEVWRRTKSESLLDRGGARTLTTRQLIE